MLHVNEERLRFAGELHDTLGQQLAALSVKTELAIALERKQDERLRAELAEIQRLIRETREEMRKVVAGYRTIYPEQELQGARSLLESMGIRCVVHGSFDELPLVVRDTVGWLLREATTNVLKHAAATKVVVDINTDSVTIKNDGVTAEIGQLSGLENLDQRARKSGGRKNR